MPQIEQIWSFPSQIIWLAITFAALFFIMWKVAVPRISAVLESRQQRIEDNLDKAAAFKKDAEAAIEAYEKAIAEARSEAQNLINETAQSLQATASKQEAELAETLCRRPDGSRRRDHCRGDGFGAPMDGFPRIAG